MALLVARFLSALRPKNSASFSASASATASITDYLKSHCGLVANVAAKVAESASGLRIRSMEKPKAVISYLRALGIDDACLVKLVSIRPQVLSANIEKTLKPKIANLYALGFSGTDVTDIITANCNVLFHKDVSDKFEFLRPLLPDRGNLLKALSKDKSLISCSVNKRLLPNAELLREHGVSDCDIGRALYLTPWMLTQDTEHLRKSISRAKRYGFTAQSGMFIHAIYLVNRVSEEALQEKFDIVKSFGLSESDCYSMLLKKPYPFGLTHDSLHKRMSFLVNTVGIDVQLICKNPVLISFSMEKRLRPRLGVRRELEANHLLGAKDTIVPMFLISERRFVDKYIKPHLRRLPQLSEIYPAALSKQ